MPRRPLRPGRGLRFSWEVWICNRVEPARRVGVRLEEELVSAIVADVGDQPGALPLLQYALAADRVDEQVAHLYELQHPGVVRLLHAIFRDAARLGMPASVCGEAAGDRRYTRLLLALGLRDFSMYPGRLLEVKQVILNTDIARATAALTRWLNETDGHPQSLLEALDASQA